MEHLNSVVEKEMALIVAIINLELATLTKQLSQTPHLEPNPQDVYST